MTKFVIQIIEYGHEELAKVRESLYINIEGPIDPVQAARGIAARELKRRFGRLLGFIWTPVEDLNAHKVIDGSNACLAAFLVGVFKANIPMEARLYRVI